MKYCDRETKHTEEGEPIAFCGRELEDGDTCLVHGKLPCEERMERDTGYCYCPLHEEGDERCEFYLSEEE